MQTTCMVVKEKKYIYYIQTTDTQWCPLPTYTEMQTVVWPSSTYDFWCLSLDMRVCATSLLGAAHESFPGSRDEEPLAVAANLSADRKGWGVLSRRMSKSHSALWVHVSSNAWTSLIRTKELAKDQDQWTLLLSLSLSQPVSFARALPGFHSICDMYPSLIHCPHLLSVSY